jgi:hypothetical protein
MNHHACPVRILGDMTLPYLSFLSLFIHPLNQTAHFSMFSGPLCCSFCLECLFFVARVPAFSQKKMSSWWQHDEVEWHDSIYANAWVQSSLCHLLAKLSPKWGLPPPQGCKKYFVKNVTCSLYYHSFLYSLLKYSTFLSHAMATQKHFSSFLLDFNF